MPRQTFFSFVEHRRRTFFDPCTVYPRYFRFRAFRFIARIAPLASARYRSPDLRSIYVSTSLDTSDIRIFFFLFSFFLFLSFHVISNLKSILRILDIYEIFFCESFHKMRKEITILILIVGSERNGRGNGNLLHFNLLVCIYIYIYKRVSRKHRLCLSAGVKTFGDKRLNRVSRESANDAMTFEHLYTRGFRSRYFCTLFFFFLPSVKKP